MYAALDGHQRVMVMYKEKIIEDDGFMVQNALTRDIGVALRRDSSQVLLPAGDHLAPVVATVYAFMGPHGPRPFTVSPRCYRHVAPEIAKQAMSLVGLPQQIQADLDNELAQRLQEAAIDAPLFNLVTALQHTLGDDFPTTVQHRMAVLIPQQEAEKQYLELMLLEELVDQAQEDKNEHAIEWVQQIEEEANISIAEVLQESRRAVMERLIIEQNAQHAAIIAAHTKNGASTITKAAGLSDSSFSALLPSDSSLLLPVLTSCGTLVELQNVQTQVLSARRHKYRHVKALLLRVLKCIRKHSQPTTTTNSGSHRTLHFRESAAITLVEVHGSKDTTVGHRFVTRIVDRLMQVAVELGL
jgi:hypothetical protein